MPQGQGAVTGGGVLDTGARLAAAPWGLSYDARVEIHEPATLARWLQARKPLAGLRLQDLDLTPSTDALLAVTDAHGLVVLGGVVPSAVADHLRSAGAVVFPAAPEAPVDVYRGRLYTADELYAGLEHGYDATPDARAYHWSRRRRLQRDAYATLLRAIHDDSVTDALDEWADGLPVVGVMGGHAADRGSEGYRQAARLGHRLAEAGYVVATGGGPGAMEAANLGATARDGTGLADAVRRLAAVPSFRPDVRAWARLALAVRDGLATPPGGRPRSLGIPTWFYGHEPPNVFAQGNAKYFSNAIREDGLLARSTAGVVVLPGAAGTVQEVFQLVTRLYYAAPGATLAPLVLVDADHWERRLPVAPLLAALGEGRALGDVAHVVADVDAALEVLTSASPPRL